MDSFTQRLTTFSLPLEFQLSSRTFLSVDTRKTKKKGRNYEMLRLGNVKAIEMKEKRIDTHAMTSRAKKNFLNEKFLSAVLLPRKRILCWWKALKRLQLGFSFQFSSQNFLAKILFCLWISEKSLRKGCWASGSVTQQLRKVRSRAGVVTLGVVTFCLRNAPPKPWQRLGEDLITMCL